MAGKSTTVTLEWNGDGILADVDKAMAAGLKQAGQHAKKVMKAKLSGPSGSPPGGPPGKVSGRLQKAVTAKAFRKKGRFVGVEVGIPKKSPYDSKGDRAGGATGGFPGRMRAQGVRLARGFTGRDRRGRVYHQAARPFALPVLRSEQSRMSSLVKDGARKYMPNAKRST